MEINIESIEKFLSMENEYQSYLDKVKKSECNLCYSFPKNPVYCDIRFKIDGYHSYLDDGILKVKTNKQD